MLREALTFPPSGRRGPVSVLIGGVLVFLRWGLLGVAATVASVAVTADGAATSVAGGALLVVAVPLALVELALRGYRIRALRATATDPDADAPGFGRVGALYRDGLLGTGVTVAYALPGVVLLAVAAVGIDAVPAMAPTPPSLADAAARNLAGLALLFGLLALVGAAYLLPAAAASAAVDRSLRSAFRRRVLAGAFSEDYAVGWMAAGLLALVVFPALVAASALVVLPLVAVPFGSFHVAVAIRHMYGAGFGAAAGLAASSTGAQPSGAGPDGRSAEEGRASTRTGPDGERRPSARDRGTDASGDDGTPDAAPAADGSTDGDVGSPADPMADEFRR